MHLFFPLASIHVHEVPAIGARLQRASLNVEERALLDGSENFYFDLPAGAAPASNSLPLIVFTLPRACAVTQYELVTGSEGEASDAIEFSLFGGNSADAAASVNCDDTRAWTALSHVAGAPRERKRGGRGVGEQM